MINSILVHILFPPYLQHCMLAFYILSAVFSFVLTHVLRSGTLLKSLRTT